MMVLFEIATKQSGKFFTQIGKAMLLRFFDLRKPGPDSRLLETGLQWI
jgi:hypothetical protein